jgi:hypothetical protein
VPKQYLLSDERAHRPHLVRSRARSVVFCKAMARRAAGPSSTETSTASANSSVAIPKAPVTPLTFGLSIRCDPLTCPNGRLSARCQHIRAAMPILRDAAIRFAQEDNARDHEGEQPMPPIQCLGLNGFGSCPNYTTKGSRCPACTRAYNRARMGAGAGTRRRARRDLRGPLRAGERRGVAGAQVPGGGSRPAMTRADGSARPGRNAPAAIRSRSLLRGPS